VDGTGELDAPLAVGPALGAAAAMRAAIVA
jgi:hypothetical protein